MSFMYKKVESVIEKAPEFRTDFECHELIGWFRNKSQLFTTLSSDIVKDVIRHCSFERKQKDDVIIKQGDNGDSLYIILKGQVSIYVVQEKENEQEIRAQVDRACAKDKLDRSLLGQHVWTSGDGHTVGEVALIKEDCIRTATVVVDDESDLMVVDRALYIRSVRDALEHEFSQKTEFVDNNPLFTTWTSKQKKSLVISLKKETMHYGRPVTRQGHNVSNLYFVHSGELEVILDHGSYKVQYPTLWAEMESLLPGLLPTDRGVVYSPYEALRRKRNCHQPQQMCLLGVNEVVGALEVVLGLETYIETSTVTCTSDIFVLSKGNYDRLFNRKSAVETVEQLKEILATRLYLYIHRSEIFLDGAPFLKFVTLKLQDSETLRLLKVKKKSTELDKNRYMKFIDMRRVGRDDPKLDSLMKRLDIRYVTQDSGIGDMEISQKVLSDLDKRLKQWTKRSKSHGTASLRNSRFGQSLRRLSSEDLPNGKLLSRAKTSL